MNKKVLIWIVLCAPLFASAQFSRLRNQPLFDKTPLHFGFHIGLNWYDFNTDLADLSEQPDLFGVTSEALPGYNINIVSNLRLTEHLDLRFTPGFAATVRKLHFDMIHPFTGERTIITRQIESSYVQFPLHLKFKSVRIDNYKLYLMGGIRYTNDLASKAKVVDDGLFKLQRHVADYEVGFGADFYFEYFKFSPQIRAAWGLTDLLVQDGTPQVEAFDALRNQAVLINFTFE
ncbi:MAG: PorT family protein [Bacteroidetes bacterium]|nr:PorT family protein [Bacteroidota bacterium]